MMFMRGVFIAHLDHDLFEEILQHRVGGLGRWLGEGGVDDGQSGQQDNKFADAADRVHCNSLAESQAHGQAGRRQRSEVIHAGSIGTAGADPRQDGA
ncbi:MAG: hypothetical protein IPG66_00300 [Hydrogenophilales bacterium]|nr:hypothetical protein [Hydrogenophilales bacterium]